MADGRGQTATRWDRPELGRMRVPGTRCLHEIKKRTTEKVEMEYKYGEYINNRG